MAFLNIVNKFVCVIILGVTLLTKLPSARGLELDDFAGIKAVHDAPCNFNGATLQPMQVGTKVENGVDIEYICIWNGFQGKNVIQRYACNVGGVWKDVDSEFTHPTTGQLTKCIKGSDSMEFEKIGCCYNSSPDKNNFNDLSQSHCGYYQDVRYVNPNTIKYFTYTLGWIYTSTALYNSQEYKYRAKCLRVEGTTDTYWKIIGCYAIEHEFYPDNFPVSPALTTYVPLGEYVEWREKNWTCLTTGNRATVVSTLK